MNTQELIRSIVGNDIPILQDFELTWSTGGGCYFFLPETGIEAILMMDPNSTDSTMMAIAIHESFHALRKKQGIKIYQKYSLFWSWKERCQEEQEVNRLSRIWVEQNYHGEKKEEILATFDKSDKSYDLKRKDTHARTLQCVSLGLRARDVVLRILGKRSSYQQFLATLDLNDIHRRIAEEAV